MSPGLGDADVCMVAVLFFFWGGEKGDSVELCMQSSFIDKKSRCDSLWHYSELCPFTRLQGMRSDEDLAKKSRPFRRKDLKMLLHVQDSSSFTMFCRLVIGGPFSV